MSVRQRARLARVVALVFSVILFVLCLAPYGFGLRAHTIMTTLVEQLAQVWHVPLITTAYQRGWFASTAEMQLAVSPALRDAWRTYVPTTAGPEGEAATVAMTHRVLHGPFPFTSATPGWGGLRPIQALLQSTVRAGSPGDIPVDPLPESVPTLHVTTTIFLNGSSQSRVFIPAFVTPPGATSDTLLVWNGLRGEVSLSQQGQHLLSAMRVPGVYLKRAQTQISLQNALLRLEARSEPQQPLSGQFWLSVDTLDVGHEAEVEWAMQEAELRTAIAMAGEVLQADVDLQCTMCRLANMASGQGQVHLEARRLSLPALLRLGQEVTALWPDEPDLGTLWLRLLLSGELTQMLAALARTSPTLALPQARLHTPEGEVLLSAHIQMHGERVLASASLPLLLQSIDAEATMEAPAAWVQAVAVAVAVHLIRKHSAFGSFLSSRSLRMMAAIAVERYLENLIGQAYLIQDGSRYKSRAHYTQGQLTVNDRAVPLPTLLP